MPAEGGRERRNSSLSKGFEGLRPSSRQTEAYPGAWCRTGRLPRSSWSTEGTQRRRRFTTIRSSLTVALEPSTAFEVLAGELADALARLGIRFEPGIGGRLVEGDVEIGRVVTWRPGARIRLEWHPPPWEPERATDVELQFEPVAGGTQVSMEQRGWERVLGGPPDELLGWFSGQALAPILRAMAPAGLGDWLTDRRVRRPTGRQAREVYQDPIYHRPNFRAILGVLALTPSDYLLEVGWGGGAFLQEALASGCRAVAIDHSADMVRLAREVNRDASAAGRLQVREGSADRLPLPDGTFTCAVMTGVFGFLPDPVQALAEIRRVLVDHGRLLLFTSSAELRGTPAAPEPIASRVRFYEDRELLELARRAGFVDVVVQRPDLESHARALGVPEAAWPLFRSAAGQLLVARKTGGS